MKIAFLAAGNSIHSYRWIKYFVDRGHQVAWVSLAPLSPEFADLAAKTEFYEIKPSPLSDINGFWAPLFLLSAVRRLKAILKQFRPQMLHIHSVGTYGLVGVLTGFKPIILNPWGSDILLTTGFKKCLVKYVVSHGDFFICDGENTFKKMLDYGLKACNGKLIRFGIELDKLGHKKDYQIKNETTVLSLRSLEPIYDIDNILEAALILKEAGHNEIKFQIAGSGTQAENLKKKSHDLGLDMIVEFLGRYKYNDLPQILEKADIYISTSLSDGGLAVSNAEAMAFKLPVILTDSGDNLLWLKQKIGGFVIPAHNPKILANSILSVIKEKAQWPTWGERNFELINANYNFQKELKKAEDFYRDIIVNYNNK